MPGALTAADIPETSSGRSASKRRLKLSECLNHSRLPILFSGCVLSPVNKARRSQRRQKSQEEEEEKGTARRARTMAATTEISTDASSVATSFFTLKEEREKSFPLHSAAAVGNWSSQVLY